MKQSGKLQQILKFSFFSTGFCSLFVLPTFHGFALVHLWITISFLLSICVFFANKKTIYISKYEVNYLLLILLFYCASICGALQSGYPSGIITSQIFLLCFLNIFFCHKFGLLQCFGKGFFYSALFSSCFIIADEINYYILRAYKPLITIIFPEYLLSDTTHVLENRQSLLNLIIYRPCGLSFDPGISVTGIILAFVLMNERIIPINKKIIKNIIIIIAIILSISKTSIICLFFYLLLKIIPIFKKRIKEVNRVVMLYVFLCTFISFFLLGFFIDYTGTGNQRHLKYFSSLINVIGTSFPDFTFGYGFTNAGNFFDKYVTWLNATTFKLTGIACESTLVNVFLIGGFLGSIFWLYSGTKLVLSNRINIIVSLTIILFICFGYNVTSCWFYLSYNLLNYYSISIYEKQKFRRRLWHDQIGHEQTLM